MIVSLFAFSYGVAMTGDAFAEAIKENEEIRAEKLVDISNMQPQKSKIGIIFDYLRKPMVPVVSAEDVNDNGVEDDEEGVTQDGLSGGHKLLGRYLTESTEIHSFPISSQAAGSGCCFVSNNGLMCATTAPVDCVDDSPFAEGVLCTQTSFCEKGCCFDDPSGIYDTNTLKLDCNKDWVADPNCNMPGAAKGCCVLDGISSFETLGQCEIRTFSFAQGDGIINWSANTNEGQCAMLSATQVEGACVMGGGACSFTTEASCYGYDGEFYEGFLCTSPHVNSTCEPTEQTICIDGKDGVYFVDSCGNIANIYDSKRANDPVYWDSIVMPEEVCGEGDTGDASADSPECGNCNRFLGSICRSALDDGFDVDMGSNYCKDTSCMFDGEDYENGESWCVYDGAIGEGNDVVGSRHWKYVCSQGNVQVEPCADYRNQVCFQTNTFDVEGEEVQFRNAACVANNWRECIDLNSQADGLELCEDTLNCRLEKINIADKFNFDVCLPKYPGGFSLSDERYMDTAKSLCGQASQNCTVIYEPGYTGGCDLVANGGCLKEDFAKQMNDFCMGIGDCGGSVNIEGVYTKNHEIRKSPPLSGGYINNLKKLAEPVPGQYAEFEDYTEYLEAAGLWGNPGVAPEEEEEYSVNTVGTIVGTAGLATAMAAVAIGLGPMTFFGAQTFISGIYAAEGLAPFAGAGIGLAIGVIAGTMIAKRLGLSPLGSQLMAVAGGLAGLGIALNTPMLGALCPPCMPYLLVAAAIIAIIALIFAGSSCDPVEVVFECKPWKPPVGSGDCENCNEDPLKPCSEYRCNSLGAACELINKGSEDEMCHATTDNGQFPLLSPRLDYISWTEMYTNIDASGFEITSLEGGCVDAYTPVVFGITTDELAYCKFDIQPTDFEAMYYDLGPNAYVYNHTTTFTLPDPSHGQSQGIDWNGDLTLYIKCEDAFGNINPEFYTVDMCVNEGPDIGSPVIRATDPANDGFVGFDMTSQDVTFTTNELATCKWGLTDVDYSEMTNDMSCTDSLNSPSNPQGYACTTTFPIDDISNEYYVRCMDQPWLSDESERNANRQSFVYTIRKPESKISIEAILPGIDFVVHTAMTTIELTVDTAGGGDYHTCSYSFSGYDRMIDFFETGTEKTHTQQLNRPAGKNKIYIRCEDETGDYAESWTDFTIIRDVSTPAIARAWQSGGTLYVITTEVGECKYTTSSCHFNWDDGEDGGSGTEHTISSTKGNTYYIKCVDEFGNAPSGCSIMLQAL